MRENVGCGPPGLQVVGMAAVDVDDEVVVVQERGVEVTGFWEAISGSFLPDWNTHDVARLEHERTDLPVIVTVEPGTEIVTVEEVVAAAVGQVEMLGVGVEVNGIEKRLVGSFFALKHWVWYVKGWTHLWLKPWSPKLR
jgi:hypothetical protein